MRTIARLKPGISATTANVQLQSLVRRLQQEYPATNANMGASLAPLHAFINGDARRPLLVLFGSVGLLLLIACANVGNLLLVQAIGKQRELSLRLALGAGHARLVRQALTESLTLSLLGGIAGLAVGWMGVRALAATQSAELLPVQEFSIDWRVLAFLLLVTTVSALLFGIAPSVWGQRQRPANALREGTRSSGDGVRMRRWGNALAVGEVALALLLTVGAGLLVRSYAALRRVDPGFQASGVLTLSLELPGGRYDSGAVLTQFDRALLDRVRATPGVSNASIVSALPLTGSGWTSDFAVRGRARDDYATEVRHRDVAGDYFGTMHVPLLRGRSFTDADANGGERVVVVNDVLVRKYFRGSDPIGQQIAFDRVPDSTSRWRTIVGVVGSERQMGMQIEPHDEIFAPLAQEQQQAIVLVVRTAGEPLSLVPAMRSALRETDPNLAIESVQTMNDVLDTSLARDRFLMTMLLVFASVGLVLAIVGVYGVLAQTARRRTREMGVRIALGARAAQLRWLVISHGLKLVAAGLLIGAMLALVMTRAMQRVLFDVPASDPVTYVVVALAAGGDGSGGVVATGVSREQDGSGGGAQGGVGELLQTENETWSPARSNSVSVQHCGIGAGSSTSNNKSANGALHRRLFANVNGLCSTDNERGRIDIGRTNSSDLVHFPQRTTKSGDLRMGVVGAIAGFVAGASFCLIASPALRRRTPVGEQWSPWE